MGKKKTQEPIVRFDPDGKTRAQRLAFLIKTLKNHTGKPSGNIRIALSSAIGKSESYVDALTKPSKKDIVWKNYYYERIIQWTRQNGIPSIRDDYFTVPAYSDPDLQALLNFRLGSQLASERSDREFGPFGSNRFCLATQKSNPQWADFRDYDVSAPRPWTLRCHISTQSPYFRFGFKLLTLDGRVFGDMTIASLDTNLLVHIGRNNWDRPNQGITARDIFLSAYMSGQSVEDDRRLFEVAQKNEEEIELTVDRRYCVNLSVNNVPAFQKYVPPEICQRVIMFAWGDREEFSVEVTGLAIKSAKRP